MRAAVLIAVVLAVAGGAFFAGRHTVGRRPAPAAARPQPGSYNDRYLAGREDAFAGYDGGWALGEPYIVTLRRGGPGITYRFARRWPLLAGREYRYCRREIICSRPAR